MTESLGVDSGFGLYVWPSSTVLADFLVSQRHFLSTGPTVLELGSGAGLPGIVASKLGAKVIFSDKFDSSLDLCRRNCAANNLSRCQVVKLAWDQAELPSDLTGIDWIIGADCFYDPSVFEDLLYTVYRLLKLNPTAVFYFSYQLRSANWSIRHLLDKWHLQCDLVPLANVCPNYTEIDGAQRSDSHSIQIGKITLAAK